MGISKASELRLLQDENNTLKMDCEKSLTELQMIEKRLIEAEMEMEFSDERREIEKLEIAPENEM